MYLSIYGETFLWSAERSGVVGIVKGREGRGSSLMISLYEKEFELILGDQKSLSLRRVSTP